jgi:hypothetical protein
MLISFDKFINLYRRNWLEWKASSKGIWKGHIIKLDGLA